MNVVTIACVIVDPADNLLKVELAVGLRRSYRHGDRRQRLAERDRPEFGIPSPLGSANKHRVIARRTTARRKRCSSAQEINFDKMDWPVQDLHTLGEVLLPIRAGPFVGGAQEFDNRHKLSAATIPDFNIAEIFKVDGRKPHVTRPAEQRSSRAGYFVDVNMLVDFHDVTRAKLGAKDTGNGRNRPFVEIVPGVFLLDVRIHSGEGRGHFRGRSLGRIVA